VIQNPPMFATRRNGKDPARSQRSMALGRNGMVCTSQTLASSAALQVLRDGGNAIDAAVCAAAMLGVVEPFSTGIGGDCFALVWKADEGRLYGITGSGRAPAGLSVETLARRGLGAVPIHGMLPVTVPGAIDAWDQLLRRFGTRTLGEMLQPAIACASEGFAVSEIIAWQWDLICQFGLLQHPDAVATFTTDGRAPRLGEIFRMPGLARSMQTIAAGGADVFYRGEIAAKIAAFSAANDGVLAAADLDAHRSSWVEPIATDYRGHRLCEIPPSGQGLAALIALNLLETFDVGEYELAAPQNLHRRIEVMKLAFADRNRFIADPEFAAVPVTELLDKDYARRRAAQIDARRANSEPGAGEPSRGTDTVYLTTADADGNVVSFINSLFQPFGSCMVAGDTGIVLQNRGYGFVTDPAHPNCVAPRKRPLHTIIPAMLFRDDRPLLSFGVMGGHIQAQGHLQVVSNVVDYGLNIQEALDYPRFHYLGGNTTALEPEYPETLIPALCALGHDARGEEAAALSGGFGGGQGILVDPATGAYWGGSDRRKDGCAIGW
jgi:gamma-glutamyltranspeptidase/glutathione hydrolase